MLKKVMANVTQNSLSGSGAADEVCVLNEQKLHRVFRGLINAWRGTLKGDNDQYVELFSSERHRPKTSPAGLGMCSDVLD